MRRWAWLVLLAACDPTTPVEVPAPMLELVTDELNAPVFATSPPGDLERLFVVEQAGRIRVLENGTLRPAAFLDLRTLIRTTGSEEGLLSLAFHPLYGANGRFYVYFTSLSGDIRIVRYLVSIDPNFADPNSADTVLAVAHPTNGNHNGGQLAFGPDGKLYAGLGDGGGGGDIPNNAQNRFALLGKLLRLDVDGTSGYTIPTDNPFASGTTAAPEIWAFGLRNPWRFSFDRQTGDLYIADVGQGEWEEVNVASAPGRGAGANYGWRIMEGMHCYNAATCTQTGLTLPVVEYSLAGPPCAVMGGYVYRGSRVPGLVGHYLYGDHCTGSVFSFRYAGGAAMNQTDVSAWLSPGGGLSSFGEDARGDVYVMTLGGDLYRIVAGP